MKRCKYSGRYFIRRTDSVILYYKILYHEIHPDPSINMFHVFMYSEFRYRGEWMLVIPEYSLRTIDLHIHDEITREEFIGSFYSALDNETLVDGRSREEALSCFRNEEK